MTENTKVDEKKNHNFMKKTEEGKTNALHTRSRNRCKDHNLTQLN